MSLKFNSANCIGCKLCQLACSAKHEGVFSLNLSRLQITSNYSKNELRVSGAICDLCLACVNVCPTEAIVYENGHLVFYPEQCIDCGNCITECPQQVITARDNGVAVCDLCDGSPLCVEWCPHQALSYKEGEQ